MKKSTKKVINHLRRYVGHAVLRTKPTHRDWSYTDGDPLLLVGFTPDGCIKYRHTGFDLVIFGDGEFILPISFTDYNWISYKKALKSKGNKLNMWKGKKIKRIHPVATSGDRSYMNGYAPTLVSASKHHIVIMSHGKKKVLGPNYSLFEDWELA